MEMCQPFTREFDSLIGYENNRSLSAYADIDLKGQKMSRTQRVMEVIEAETVRHNRLFRKEQFRESLNLAMRDWRPATVRTNLNGAQAQW